MRIYADHHKPTPKSKASSSARFHREIPGQDRELGYILQPRRMIGRRVGAQLLPAGGDGRGDSLLPGDSHRLGGELGRAPVQPALRARAGPKLAVSGPGDAGEQQADRVAEQILRMPAPELRRGCACGGGCPECSNERGRRTPGQMQSTPTSDHAKPAAPLAPWNPTRASGKALDPPTREFMESRFRRDFSGVRVHTDPVAAQVAHTLRARAFTLGQNIVFGDGQYSPSTASGRRLLAHELTHTVQQRQFSGAPSVVQRVPTGPQVPGGALREPISLITPDISNVPDILDAATMAVGWSLGRALTPAELAILTPVFGPHLNYTVMRICSHQLCSPDGIARTVGNLIATPPGGISNSTLVHESAHVWQHQNGIRYSYISSALLSQFGAWLITGSRSAAYNWQIYYNNSVPWMAWNAEAQAQYVEDNMTLPPLYVWGTGGLLPVP